MKALSLSEYSGVSFETPELFPLPVPVLFEKIFFVHFLTFSLPMVRGTRQLAFLLVVFPTIFLPSWFYCFVKSFPNPLFRGWNITPSVVPSHSDT